jgi:hypothetical protein
MRSVGVVISAAPHKIGISRRHDTTQPIRNLWFGSKEEMMTPAPDMLGLRFLCTAR